MKFKLSVILALIIIVSLPLSSSELRKYGTATTIYFPLLDPNGSDFEATPVTCASGDVLFSEDGAAFGSTNSCFAHEGNGIYSLALLGTELEGKTVVVIVVDQTSPKAWIDQGIIVDTYGSDSAQHAFDLDWNGFLDSTHSIVTGTVDTGSFSPTTAAFEADLTDADGAVSETTADHFNGRIIVFTSGDLKHQATRIADYEWANSNGKFTVTALTEAPGNGDTFIIL